MSLAFAPTAARAEGGESLNSLPRFDLQRLRMDPSALGSLMVGTGRTLPQGMARVSFNFHYENLPMRFQTRWEPGAGVGLVENKMTLSLTAAYGVFSWLDVGAELPFIISQNGQPTLAYSQPQSSGLATPWLSARVALLRMTHQAPLNLALAMTAGLPVGSEAALGREDHVYQPRLQLGYVGEGFQVGGEASLYLRQKRDLTPVSYENKDIVGNELRLAATVTSREGETTRGEVSALVGLPLQGGRIGAELLVAIRRHTLPGLDLYVMGGPGVGAGLDTPTFRFVAGASFATDKVD
ncbi:flagellar motor protein MotB [Myxococcaceae bacterium JPH2]|nr:flagellar motor protein MotB [Myxococcaceae bacterium JPH2]